MGSNGISGNYDLFRTALSKATDNSVKIKRSDIINIFNNADTNNDNQITTEEFLANAEKYFKDVNFTSDSGTLAEAQADLDKAWDAFEDEYDIEDGGLSFDDFRDFNKNINSQTNQTTSNNASAGNTSAGNASSVQSVNQTDFNNAQIMKNNEAAKSSVASVNAASLKGRSLDGLKAERQKAIDDLYTKKQEFEEGHKEEIDAAQSEVDAKQQAYDEALQSTESTNEEFNELKEQKADNAAAINDQKGVIDGLEGNIDAAKSKKDSAQSKLDSLTAPSKGDYTKTDEDGKETVDEAAYNAALETYKKEKAAAEKELSDAEREITNLTSELINAEDVLAGLEQEGEAIEAMISGMIESGDSGIEDQESVKTAQSELDAAKQALAEAEQNNETAALQSDISAIEQNIQTYDNAISEAEAQESSSSYNEEDARVDEEEDQRFVNVEKYVDNDDNNDGCLERIIKNSYNLEEMGITLGSAEYYALENAVMTANEQIFTNGRESVLYTGDKITLPDAYEIQELKDAGIVRKDPERKEVEEIQMGTYNIPDSKTITVYDKNGRAIGKETYAFNKNTGKYSEEPTDYERYEYSTTSGNRDSHDEITKTYDKDGNLKSELVSTRNHDTNEITTEKETKYNEDGSKTVETNYSNGEKIVETTDKNGETTIEKYDKNGDIAVPKPGDPGFIGPVMPDCAEENKVNEDNTVDETKAPEETKEPEAPEEPEGELSIEQIDAIIDTLYELSTGMAGTDEKNFSSLIKGDLSDGAKISDEDYIRIGIEYNRKYEDGLVHTIKKEFSGSKEEDLINTYAERLVNAANNGLAGANELLAIELEHSMNGIQDSNKQFVEYVLKNANNNVITDIDNNYNAYNTDNLTGSLLSAVGTYFTGNTKEEFMDYIQDKEANLGNGFGEQQIKRYADKLYEAVNGPGTNENKFENIMFNDEISNADFVEIASEYQKNHTSLVKDMRGDFSGKDENNLVTTYAEKLVEEANNGNESAKRAIAVELYYSMNGFGTCDEFVTTVLGNNGLKSDIIREIDQNFESWTNKSGADLKSMIKGDFSGQDERDLNFKVKLARNELY